MRQIINNYGRPGKLILNAGKIVDKLKQLFVFNMVLSRIGQDTCEKLDYIPAKVRGCSATSAINMPAKPVKALKMTVPR